MSKTPRCEGVFYGGQGVDSKVFTFGCSASFADIERHQFALAAVELFVFGDFPLVKTAFAQGFSLVNITGFAGCRTLEGKNVGHVS